MFSCGFAMSLIRDGYSSCTDVAHGGILARIDERTPANDCVITTSVSGHTNLQMARYWACCWIFICLLGQSREFFDIWTGVENTLVRLFPQIRGKQIKWILRTLVSRFISHVTAWSMTRKSFPLVTSSFYIYRLNVSDSRKSAGTRSVSFKQTWIFIIHSGSRPPTNWIL